MKTEKDQQQEMLALSDEAYSVDELEERIELSIALVDSLCVGNLCGANACVGNFNW